MNSFLLITGLFLNTVSLSKLVRERFVERKKKRMSLLLIHLGIADLMVILLHTPLEIVWSVTVTWEGSNLLCKICIFARSMGFFLSSLIIMVISVDRLHAVLFPIHHRVSSGRTKLMLALAWVAAPILSIPQLFVWSLKNHPFITDYFQCTPIGYFENQVLKVIYNVFVNMCLSVLPFTVMLICYVTIMVVITRRKSASLSASNANDQTRFDKARLQTVKITGVLIFGFILCWAPYNVMTVWFLVDSTNAKSISYTVQKFLWSFSCANNCLNPFFYNIFSDKSESSPNPGHESQSFMLRNSTRGSTSCYIEKRRGTKPVHMKTKSEGCDHLNKIDIVVSDTGTKSTEILL
ncbi:gonadotropin-releasing hormone receptor [Eurytemora carolleeae]|uniref:gonadotropin-releasing hormone receptor n=1 Tax=Eurytemora carolleeae TaxID=1294199 RepID=UPI000C7651D6|nr:gonadotropin-releasing hormone receptor [Eurytemora carolleeae]|eukprot:XP_023341315.1 gonadotropin-releasing hormone receptor-like [Eurytemora affinis]